MDNAGGFHLQRKANSGGGKASACKGIEQTKAPKQKRKRQGPLELIGQTDAQAKRNRRVKVSLASPYQTQSFGTALTFEQENTWLHALQMCVATAKEENVSLKTFLVCGVNDVTTALESHQRRLFQSFLLSVSSSSPLSSPASSSASSAASSASSGASFASSLSSISSASSSSSSGVPSSSSAAEPSVSSPRSGASSSSSSSSSASCFSSSTSPSVSPFLPSTVSSTLSSSPSGALPVRNRGETQEKEGSALNDSEGGESERAGARDLVGQCADMQPQGIDEKEPTQKEKSESVFDARETQGAQGESVRERQSPPVTSGDEREARTTTDDTFRRSEKPEGTHAQASDLGQNAVASHVEKNEERRQTRAERGSGVVGAIGIVNTGLGARIVQHLPLMAALLGLPCLIFKCESTALCDIIGLPSVAAFAVLNPSESCGSPVSLFYSPPSSSPLPSPPGVSPSTTSTSMSDASAVPYRLRRSIVSLLSLSSSWYSPSASFPFFLPRPDSTGASAAGLGLLRRRAALQEVNNNKEVQCVSSSADFVEEGVEARTTEAQRVREASSKGEEGRDGEGAGEGIERPGDRGWQSFLRTCLATSFCDPRDAEAGNKKTRRATRRVKRRERRRLLFERAKARTDEKKAKTGKKV
ncbi:hypothetical protein TGVEG_264472 [Toxoplasma gondii VEG]|uniref:Uncharacterized protein n=2 Tax=Toxoplasma gondii TaxID=5811 RepID=V4ZMZ5_TOXGV|nr:hypothetical protein TGVEG_264472 [Toxoplasma gondii VEG]KFG32508.1 hypothetical protein TGP89_264472 [Toxoplasma gondii p89]CEL75813.1 TPA: hypothetical protein BN1205_081695 [Toxoplasma gondii VEG]